jgi:hypothetical protein
MKLFEYKPVEYVDVHNEIPVEWMAGQLKEKQTAFDSQLDAINKTSENNLKLNTGAFGNKVYEELQKDLQGRLDSMTSNLMTRGDVAGTSGQFSKYLRDFSLDPRVKVLNKDYDLWKQHQETLLQHPGAIDMTQYGPQIGENGTTPEQAFRNYSIVLPENSIAELEQTVTRLKPNVSDDGTTFSFYDPIAKRMIQSKDRKEIEELSATRIKQLRDDYYANWKNNPKSMYHKIKLSGNKLDLFNTPEGKQKYDELTEYLQSYAYTAQNDLPDQDPYGGGSRSQNNGGGNNPNKPKINLAPTTSQAYGRYYALGEVDGTPGTYIVSRPTMVESIANIDNQIRLSYQKMYALQGKPGQEAAYAAADAEYKALVEKKNTNIAWQKYVETDDYGKASNPVDLAKAEKEYVQKAIGDLVGDEHKPSRWSSDYQQRYKDWEAAQNSLQGLKDYMRKYNVKAGNINAESIDDFLADGAKWSNIKGDIYRHTLGPNSVESRVHEKYKQYNAYQTTGTSYIISGDAPKAFTIDLFQSLISQGPPKNTMTDKEVSKLELDETLKAYEKTDGTYDLTRISYEVLADDMDGLVLVAHMVDKEGKAHGYEYNLENTPNIRQMLGEMVPHERLLLSEFTEATQTLKKSHRQATGSFGVERFDGSKDNIKFERRPDGRGKFIYVVKNNDQERVFQSINDMIIGVSKPLKIIDAEFDIAYDKLQAAIKSRDTAAYNEAVDELEELKIVNELGRINQQPGGKQGQFRQTPRTPLQ